MKTVGFLVNPIAGMGGTVGLKGTDGKELLKKALALGAEPFAPFRAEVFLSKLIPFKEKLKLIVGSGQMGEEEARNCGFTFKVLGIEKDETSAEDTKEVAKMIRRVGVDLLVFCGGDGTARDILDAISLSLPVLGVPTGVKMHSAVFAVDPSAAARITSRFLWGHLPLKEVEVMDVDEEAYRDGRLSARLYGYLLTPYEPTLIQGLKRASPVTENEVQNQAAIAIYLIEEMDPNVVYILGPGTTTRTIPDLLDEQKTLLGVDLLYSKKIIAKDVNEKEILAAIKGKPSRIIVTPIGGQGFIFGRGNQQISPVIIRKVGIENIRVIATRGKLRSLTTLRVDTGDQALDDVLKGYIKVVTDYREEHVMRVE